MASVQLQQVSPRYYLTQHRIINTHTMHYRREILGPTDEVDKQVDLWEVDDPFPLFASAGTLVLTGDDPSEDGNAVQVLGLDDNGLFQFEDVIIGASAGIKVWNPLLARLALRVPTNGADIGNERHTAETAITATIDGSTIGAKILQGLAESNVGARVVPAGERWYVSIITSASIQSGVRGQTDAQGTIRLRSAFPDDVLKTQEAFNFGNTIVPGDTFYDAGTSFFLTAQTDTLGPIIGGTATIHAVELPV